MYTEVPAHLVDLSATAGYGISQALNVPASNRRSSHVSLMHHDDDQADQPGLTYV